MFYKYLKQKIILDCRVSNSTLTSPDSITNYLTYVNIYRHMKFKDLFVDSLKDNKKLIIGLYILFIVCFVLTWLLSADKVGTAVSNVQASNTTASNMMNVGAVDLFIQNEWGGIMTYVGSIFFAIPAIVMLIYNAVNLGAIGQLFATVLPNGGARYILYLIPHGIFEITATVIQSVAGIVLFLFIWRFAKAWRNNGASGAFDETKEIFYQSLMLMIIATILLLIAAPIEAYVSVPFSQLILGS